MAMVRTMSPVTSYQFGGITHPPTDAGLPYFASVWMVNDRPYVLSHALVARVAWHVGTRPIDVSARTRPRGSRR